MGHEVYAGGWEVAGKAGSNKSIARFPDVCLSPPSPPAGPIPVPYPDTALSSDLKEGSQTVLLGGEPAALAQQSHYKPSALGNEAATNSFGANVVTHVITGKTVFQSWSMDVQVEGKQVCRHFDMTTSNHACPPPATPPNKTIEAASLAKIEAGKCPCCDGPLHDNQKDASGKPLKPIAEEDYYKKKKGEIDKKSAGYPAWEEKMRAEGKPERIDAPMTLKFGSDMYGPFTGKPAEVAAEEARRAQQMLDELTGLTAANPDCPNVNKPQNAGCGVHFDLPPDQNTEAQRNEFDKKHRDKFVEHWKSRNPGNPVPKGTSINHKTPLDAGGCPAGGGPDKGYPGLVPDHVLTGDCAKIEARQTALQGRKKK
jgi:hypothetical protein